MKLRFAWTPHNREIVSRIADWIKQNRPLETYALLDASMFASHEVQELERHGVVLERAFGGTPLAGYDETGPVLCRIGDADHNAIQRLTWKAKGVPALSFIATRSDIDTLRTFLAWLAVAQTEDGQNLLCRYADTRILPSHLDCLMPDQAISIAASVDAWAWIGRDGSLQERRFEAPEEVEELDVEPLRLSAVQFEQVMTAAEPDMLFQMLVEHSPELIPGEQAHHVHARLAKLIEAAKGCGLVDLPDFFTYITLALLTYDHFDQHPGVQETWLRLKSGEGRFGELVEQWPENTIGLLQALRPTVQDGIPSNE